MSKPITQSLSLSARVLLEICSQSTTNTPQGYIFLAFLLRLQVNAKPSIHFMEGFSEKNFRLGSLQYLVYGLFEDLLAIFAVPPYFFVLKLVKNDKIYTTFCTYAVVITLVTQTWRK